MKRWRENSPRWPALWFVYILMHGKEEWVLVQLGSQSKCTERPVRPVFSNYLSVSCDYGETKVTSKLEIIMLDKLS